MGANSSLSLKNALGVFEGAFSDFCQARLTPQKWGFLPIFLGQNSSFCRFAAKKGFASAPFALRAKKGAKSFCALFRTFSKCGREAVFVLFGPFLRFAQNFGLIFGGSVWGDFWGLFFGVLLHFKKYAP